MSQEKEHLNSFSERLNSAFSKSNYSKSSLGRAISVTHTTISRYLKGDPPPQDLLEPLADRLNVDIHWLLTGHNPMKVDPRRQAAAKRGEEKRKAALTAGLEDKIESTTLKIHALLYQFPAINEKVKRDFKNQIDQHISEFEQWCEDLEKQTKDS